jgi:hypothetical protein
MATTSAGSSKNLQRFFGLKVRLWPLLSSSDLGIKELYHLNLVLLREFSGE